MDRYFKKVNELAARYDPNVSLEEKERYRKAYQDHDEASKQFMRTLTGSSNTGNNGDEEGEGDDLSCDDNDSRDGDNDDYEADDFVVDSDAEDEDDSVSFDLDERSS